MRTFNKVFRWLHWPWVAIQSKGPSHACSSKCVDWQLKYSDIDAYGWEWDSLSKRTINASWKKLRMIRSGRCKEAHNSHGKQWPALRWPCEGWWWWPPLHLCHAHEGHVTLAPRATHKDSVARAQWDRLKLLAPLALKPSRHGNKHMLEATIYFFQSSTQNFSWTS